MILTISNNERRVLDAALDLWIKDTRASSDSLRVSGGLAGPDLETAERLRVRLLSGVGTDPDESTAA